MNCLTIATLLAAAAALRAGAPLPTTPAAPSADWHMNATAIEACSCPMFCQCYFKTRPAERPGCCPPDADPRNPPRFCRFNMAYRVNRGSFDGVALDGARFWLAGDLGGDFSGGEADWAAVHFDPSVTPAQRAGITTILGQLFPVRWKSLEVRADYPIEWKPGKDRSVARLGERTAEIVLVRNQGMTDEPIVIHNLKYWGAPRNDGFVLMGNEVEAYRLGGKPYEYRGTNGFMITVDVASGDRPAGELGR